MAGKPDVSDVLSWAAGMGSGFIRAANPDNLWRLKRENWILVRTQVSLDSCKHMREECRAWDRGLKRRILDQAGSVRESLGLAANARLQGVAVYEADEVAYAATSFV